MFELTGPKKLDYKDHRQGKHAAYSPYSRSAVARRRKARGLLGKRKLTLPSSGGKQPIGAKPVSTKPTDSLPRQRWFQT